MGMSWYVGTSSKVVILNCFGHKIIILFSNKSMDGFLGGQLKKKLEFNPPKKNIQKTKHSTLQKKQFLPQKNAMFCSSSNSASSRCCSSSNFWRRSKNFCLRKKNSNGWHDRWKKVPQRMAGDFWKY